MRQVQHFRSSSVDITVCRPAAAGLRGSDTTPCNPLPLPHREEWNLQVGDELLLAPPVRKYPSIEFGAKQCRASAQMICPSSLRDRRDEGNSSFDSFSPCTRPKFSPSQETTVSFAVEFRALRTVDPARCAG